MSSSGPKPAPTATVLIVDDTPASLRLLTEHLEVQGMRALVAVDGEEALARTRLVQPDIVLMDVMMPGLNGMATLRLMKQDASIADIPVILMTSLHDTEHKLEGFQAGAVDYITKPLQLEEVTARLRTHLSLRELRTGLEAKNARLLVEIGERHKAEEALHESHALLEKRVADRTIELAEINRRLSEEVSERRRAEATLRTSEERYRFLYEDNPAMYFTLDANGVILSVNRHGASQLGYTPAELEGHGIEMIYGKTEQEKLRKHIADCIANEGHTLTWELHKLRKGGDVLDVKEQARALRQSDGTWIVLMVCEDITSKLRLETQLRQAQKMEAFGQLAGGVAHDFNNILTVILGQAQCVEFPNVGPEELTEALKEISQAAQRASNLTRQLLLFSRRQNMAKTLIEPNKVVSELAKMLRRMIGEDISLTLSLCSEPCHIMGDCSMIEQVLMNMAVNARDAMPRGGVLSISSARITLNQAQILLHPPSAYIGSFIRISVKDSGMGIPLEHLPNIFEPFYTTKKVGHGTGLGLATSQSIVQQNQGWIEVQSRENEGTEFQIYLPLAPNAKVKESAAPFPTPYRLGSGAVILLVEDEEAVRKSTTRMLSRSGYTVLEASNADDALILWSQKGKEIDLLLTDVVMPGTMNGHELAQTLSAQRPELKFAFMSGYDPHLISQKDPEDKLPRHFLAKPFTIDSLLKFVDGVLR